MGGLSDIASGPIGTVVSAGGNKTLGTKLFGFGVDNTPGFKQIQQKSLENLTAQSGDLATKFMDNYNKGILPPDMQAQLDLLTSQSMSSIKSTFWSLGLAGSTMEASAIAYAKTQILAQKADMIQQQFNDATAMFQVELSSLGMGTNLSIANSQISAQQQSQGLQSIGEIGAAIGDIMSSSGGAAAAA